MNRTRDFRRHQMWKHKREAMECLKQWTVDTAWIDNKQIGMSARTPKMCSYACCGNSRRYYGRTRQEIWNELDLLDEITCTDEEFTEYYEMKEWIDLENYLNQIGS